MNYLGGAIWDDFEEEVVFKQNLEVWIDLQEAATRRGGVFMEKKILENQRKGRVPFKN